MRAYKLAVIGLAAVILFMCTVLFFHGNYVVYILSYVFCFLFLLCYAAFAPFTVREKAAQITVYALIMTAQILFAVFILRVSEGEALSRLACLALLFVPFLVRTALFLKHAGGVCIAPSLEEWPVFTYAQLLSDKEMLADKIERARKAGGILSKGQLWGILQELPRHRSFSYVNHGSLTEAYFEKARQSLKEEALYLVLTRSKSAASEVIGLFTKKQYNHVSLSFDKELHTILSYNGGERPEPPGLNPELVRSLAGRDGASVMVYRLLAGRRQKRMILDKIYEINMEGSAYNLLGLLFKASYQPNIMFCSQFVYTMLELSGLNYFEKDAAHVTPTDFIELDYYRKLEFVMEITFHEPEPVPGNASANGIPFPGTVKQERKHQ